MKNEIKDIKNEFKVELELYTFDSESYKAIRRMEARVLNKLESLKSERDEDKTQFLRRWMTFANEKELTNKESQIFENSIQKFLKSNQRNDN